MSSTSNTEGKPSFKKYVPKNAREMSQFRNKIPFGDEMYDTLKWTVGTLSERMKSKDKPLDMATIDKLDQAIEEIIADAHMYGPPKRPDRSDDDQKGDDEE